MNGRDAAVERLLDTGLQERFADRRAPDVREAVAARLAVPAEVNRPADHRHRLATAALVLLGVFVAGGVAWLRNDEDAAQVQEPERLIPPDLPPSLIAQSAAALARIAADVTSLHCMYEVPASDYQLLERFVALRRLAITGPAVTSPWPADVFAPFTAMPALTVLELPLQPAMTPEHLRSLAKVPQLQFLTLHLNRPLLAKDVAALQALPNVRSLSLMGGSLDAHAVRAMSLLPALESLTLARIGGCTEPVLRELRTVHRLRRMRLYGIGETSRASRLGSPGVAGAGLSVAVAKALGELPLLDEVSIEQCSLSAEAVTLLPERLRGFALTRCPDAGADVVEALLRFRGLRRLELDRFERRWWITSTAARPTPRVGPPEFDAATAGMPDQEPIWRAQAELLRKLPVQRLRYWSALPAEVAEALPAAASLAEIELVWCGPAEIEAVAKVQKLRRLRLESCRFTVEDVRPLTAVRSLAQLDLRWASGSREDYAALLPGVAVTVQ